MARTQESIDAEDNVSTAAASYQVLGMIDQQDKRLQNEMVLHSKIDDAERRASYWKSKAGGE